jgi:hypothetical protein
MTDLLARCTIDHTANKTARAGSHRSIKLFTTTSIRSANEVDTIPCIRDQWFAKDCKTRSTTLDMPEPSPISSAMIVPGSTESPPCRDGTCWGSDDKLTPGMIRRRFIGLVLNDERRTNAEKQALIEKLMRNAEVWESLARQIDELPIPTAVETMVDIHCSDCDGTSFNRKWHFMGVQCPTCTSFDTTILPVVIDKVK